MPSANIGLIGLGTMGAMIALNIAENGHRIAVYNRTTEKTRRFFDIAGELQDNIEPCDTLETLVEAIAEPRSIILMLPAGQPIDDQIAALRPLLGPDDLIIDAGNANFRDTERRYGEAEASGTAFLGIGVSGGEEGARFGPAIMGGGSHKHWAQVENILHSISAKYEGAPCADFFGSGGAGHFVKAVHNGIEYADMQIIAEAYGIMRDGWQVEPNVIGQVFERWNSGLLSSYLIEISGKIGQTNDPETDVPMLTVIQDRAGQKGTGRWTVIEAQHLGTPITVIDAAVAARNTSARKESRIEGEALFGASPTDISADTITESHLEDALIAAKILCYTQGYELLRDAGKEFGWALDLAAIARVWREGCIIRSAMLNDMASAFAEAPETSLMHATYFADLLREKVPALRHVVATSVAAGHAVPAFASALAYFDAMRTGRSTANMLQAQRDFFGAHGFERTDRDGSDFHGPWAMAR